MVTEGLQRWAGRNPAPSLANPGQRKLLPCSTAPHAAAQAKPPELRAGAWNCVGRRRAPHMQCPSIPPTGYHRVPIYFSSISPKFFFFFLGDTTFTSSSGPPFQTTAEGEGKGGAPFSQPCCCSPPVWGCLRSPQQHSPAQPLPCPIPQPAPARSCLCAPDSSVHPPPSFATREQNAKPAAKGKNP